MKRPQAGPAVPEKHFYKIGEAAGLVGVRTSVLRFWEAEFPQIRPSKSPNGHRVYARADVELLRRIKVLVHDRGYTLSGAKALLSRGDGAVQAVLDAAPLEVALERDETAERLRLLEAQHAARVADLAELAKAARGTAEETAHWRARAESAEGRLRDLAAAAGPILSRLSASAKPLRTQESD